MNYLKENHLTLLIIIFLLFVGLNSGKSVTKVITESLDLGGLTDVTSIDNPWVFNQQGRNVDFIVEGDTDTQLIFADASVDQVSVGGFTQGTGIFSTSTTGTFTEAQMLANSGIYITAAGAGQAVLALTLPATSTMTTLIPDAGDCREWFIDASDVAAATTTTITAGTGWNLVGLDATGAGSGADVIDGVEYGKLVACRETDTDVVGYVEEWLAAD